jgi:hypothetical protein
MREAEHVECIREMINAFRILLGSLKERDHLEDRGANAGIILK